MPTIKNYEDYLDPDADPYSSIKEQQTRNKRLVKEKRDALSKKKTEKQNEVVRIETPE